MVNHIKNLSLHFTLLQGADVYAPEALGKKDILLCQEKIVAVEEDICPDNIPNCTVYDFRGMTVCPGLIDQHVHLIGGGGEAGPYSRTPEVVFSALVEAGITTAVGLLGTDSITRHPESLLAKARALNEEGITAYMLTGAYTVPTPTITGSIQKDVALIDLVIGTKTAISDHRSSVPDIGELCKIASSTRVGGLLGGKAGISVFHMGNSHRLLQPLYAILESSDVPINKLLPTHVNRTSRLFDEAIVFAQKGGSIDLTSGISPDSGMSNALKPSQAIIKALNANVALNQITMSSDGNGSQPVFNKQGDLTGITVAGFSSLLNEVRDLVQIEKLPLSEALCPVTTSVAKVLQIDKGVIRTDGDADLLVLDNSLTIKYVFARGKKVVENGIACVKGTFE